MATEEAIPDEELADMQREEIHALEAIFDVALELRSSRREDDFDFPIVYRIKLNEIDIGMDTTDGTTNWPKRPLVVELRYPKKYPSDNNNNIDGEDDDRSDTVPSFELLHENTVLEFPSRASDKLLAVLRDTARNERGMPCVLSCIFAAREFLDGDREWQDDAGNQTARGNSPDGQAPAANGSVSGTAAATNAIPKNTTHYACISTHHLFDHKPDNLLKTGHKCRLSGFYKFGTPGIAIAWGDTEGIEDFLDALKRAMPQKKFELVFLRSWDEPQPEYQIPEGWKSVDPAALREGLAGIGAPEEDYYTALGIEKSTTKDCKSKGKGTNKKNK